MLHSSHNIFSLSKPLHQSSFSEGCLLLVDKPLEWTSFDVVNKIRSKIKYIFKLPKIKVGHAGTLDPLATGLLIVCTGKYTRLINDMQDMTKEYEGLIYLGETTPTYDRESEVHARFSIEHITDNSIEEACLQFKGPVMQQPPVFSAIKIKGQKAYSLARRGENVEMKPRPVILHELVLKREDMHTLFFKVHCSKGTYIRSLAHDLGKFLGSGAVLHQLRRTRIGDYPIKDAHSIDTIIQHMERNAPEDF
ncbi:MAG TPA: tRNA pseudouridine(55) synthase TruB [Saprospiraceae bacterium]|nr:tRNA pseudouridine(55) synthase TruB [Saprospiraceae bacterium]